MDSPLDPPSFLSVLLFVTVQVDCVGSVPGVSLTKQKINSLQIMVKIYKSVFHIIINITNIYEYILYCNDIHKYLIATKLKLYLDVVVES